MAALLGVSLWIVSVSFIHATTTTFVPPGTTTTSVPMATTTTSMPTVASLCADDISDCVAYGSHICTDNRDWAELHCRDFCGLCAAHTLVPTPGPEAPIKGVCHDEVTDCHTYGKDMCDLPDYVVWAKQHCADYCGFCTKVGITSDPNNTPSPYVTGTPSVTSGPGSHCVDVLPNCRDYGQYACTQNTDFALHKCPHFCGNCTGTDPLHQTGLTGGTGGACVDKSSDCQKFGQHLCQDPKFDIWIKQNCARMCHHCGDHMHQTGVTGMNGMTGVHVTGIPGVTGGTGGACVDKSADCQKFRPEICHSGKFAPWIAHNCPRTCNLCGIQHIFG